MVFLCGVLSAFKLVYFQPVPSVSDDVRLITFLTKPGLDKINHEFEIHVMLVIAWDPFDVSLLHAFHLPGGSIIDFC